jgi:hypothetical protein
MKFSIPENDKAQLLGQLQTANLKFQQTYPGDKPDRQPVHTVYGGTYSRQIPVLRWVILL